MKCFYHSADLDGHCSGAIVKYVKPDCELIGINYGDEFPWDTINQGETVYMVDFCLQPFSDMIRLEKMCDLIWIDHHKSAIDEAYKVKFLAKEQSLVDGVGACELVWKYFSSQMPYSVKLLAEYDVWNHSDPNTIPFQFGIRVCHTIPDDEGIDFWKDLFFPGRNESLIISRIVEQGKTILHYLKQDNEKYISACGFDTELDGLRCIAVNKMLTNSQIFDSVWDEEKYDAMLTFGFRKGKWKYDAMLTFGFRKGKWTVSLYSTKNDIDVSVIAKNRGGGGHKGAAGFQCEELPFALN